MINKRRGQLVDNEIARLHSPPRNDIRGRDPPPPNQTLEKVSRLATGRGSGTSIETWGKRNISAEGPGRVNSKPS